MGPKAYAEIATGEMNKNAVYEALVKVIQERGAEMQLAWNELMESNKQEGKSSAGDKHETAAAQVHLELEKMGKQMQEHQRKCEELERFNPAKLESSKIVRSGSLVETSVGWFYIITSLGKLMTELGDCFVVSASSPVGAALLGKQSGEGFHWNGREGRIVDVL
jgi:transcription elongation GreA/GreB family factor